MRRALLTVLALLAALLAPTVTASAAPSDVLLAGVGRADLTSPTGYYMQGWVRSDAVLRGVHTRIEARAVVLQRGGKKLALVAVGLNGVAGGVLADAAKLLAGRGFSEQNIVVSASHTHAAPSGYYNFDTYNTVFMTTSTLTDQNVTGALDPQLYAFEVRRLAEAIAAADDNLGPARLGWGSSQLSGLTANRSLEAHLRDHGIVKAYDTGRVADDPDGYEHTIDSDVQVLRIDKLLDGAYRPVGGWSTFADHGTTNQYTYGVYNDDHHGAATRVFEDEVRRRGGTPAGQDVVNAYGNTDEGDQSAGLVRNGPAWAEQVGRAEAAAMLGAWTAAGRSMTTTPELDTRWTRACFCGRGTAAGPVSARGQSGLPLFTGSEEGRGPLFDLTQTPFEGRASAVDDPIDPAQGHKIIVTRQVAGHARGGPAAGRPGGRTADGDDPGRDDRRDGPPGAHSPAVGRGQRRDHRRAAVRPGERVPVLLRHAGGVRRPALRGWLADVRADVLGAAAGGAGRAHGSARRGTAGDAGVRLRPAQRRDGGGRGAVRHRRDVGDRAGTARRDAAAAAGRLRLAGRPARARHAAGQTVRHGRAADGQHLDQGAGRPRPDADVGGRRRRPLRPCSGRCPATSRWASYRFVVTAHGYRLSSIGFSVLPATTLSVDRTASGSVVRYPDAVTEVDFTYRPAVADGAAAPAAAVAAGAVTGPVRQLQRRRGPGERSHRRRRLRRPGRLRAGRRGAAPGRAAGGSRGRRRARHRRSPRRDGPVRTVVRCRRRGGRPRAVPRASTP